MQKNATLLFILFLYSCTIFSSSCSSSSSFAVIDEHGSKRLKTPGPNDCIFQIPNISAKILEFLVDPKQEQKTIVAAAEKGDFVALHHAATMLIAYEKSVLHNTQNFIQDYRNAKGHTLLHLTVNPYPNYSDPKIGDLYGKKQFLTQLRLIHYGCDVNILSNKGQSLLHKAAMNPNLGASCRLFLQAGAAINIELKTRDVGRTPLLLAAELGNIQAIKILKSAGADINAVDNHGNTAIHCLIIPSINSPEVFKTFINSFKALETLVFLGAPINTGLPQSDFVIHSKI